jgi:hypothetical protein
VGITVNPNAKAAMRNPISVPTGTMVGGGRNSGLETWFIIAITFVAVGGFAIAGIRNLRNMSLQKERNDYPPEERRDDSPPKPRDV